MGVEFCQKLFLQLLRWSHGFYSSICWCGVSHVWFVDTEKSFHSWEKSHLIMYMLLLMYYWIQIVSILLVYRFSCLYSVIYFMSISVSCCSVTQSCLTLYDPMQHARPPCPSPTPEFIQSHVHWVSDAIQPSYPLTSPSPATFSLSQHQSLLQWINSLHQVAKVLEVQL